MILRDVDHLSQDLFHCGTRLKVSTQCLHYCLHVAATADTTVEISHGSPMAVEKFMQMHVKYTTATYNLARSLACMINERSPVSEICPPRTWDLGLCDCMLAYGWMCTAGAHVMTMNLVRE